MDKELKEIITGILKIIEYEDDTEAFSEKFTQLVFTKACLDLIASADENARKDLLSLLDKEDPSSEQIADHLQKHMSKEDIAKSLEHSFTEIFEEYFNEILPALTAQQQNMLKDYLTNETPISRP